jgi:hypothetical protein
LPVVCAFAEVAPSSPGARPDQLAPAMKAHGRLSGAELVAELDAARRHVLGPCIDALLAT